MKMPEKAVILAAGFGSRMRPITESIPKPLLPVWGKPSIQHTIETLAKWGVKDILINLHHEPAPLFEFINEYSCPGVKIEISYEPEILGTGGALRRAEWFLDTPSFWMVNSDIAFDVDPAKLVKTMRTEKPNAVLWLTDEFGPRTVEMQNGLIKSFSSSRPGSSGTYTFCGLQLISSEILRHLPESSFSSIIEAYKSCMTRKKRNVIGLTVPGSYWSDVGTPEEYISAHREIRKRANAGQPGGSLYDRSQDARSKELRSRGVRVSGFAYTAPSAVIAANASIHDSIILDGASLTRSARCSGAIIAPGCMVTAPASLIAVPLYSASNPAADYAVKRLGWKRNSATYQPLAPRGSARSFSRISCRGKSVIFVEYSMERPENARYIPATRFLAGSGVNVPEIVFNIKEKQQYILEDIGDYSLGHFLQESSKANVLAKYKQVIEQVILLHSSYQRAGKAKRPELEQPFSKKLYKWERSLFADYFLSGLNNVSQGEKKKVLCDLENAAAILSRSEKVLLHRDLQSSNIHLVKGKPVFIDFQGMRLGPPEYDLASLLCDPYVSLSQSTQDALLDYYCQCSDVSLEKFEHRFWIAAVQRLSQALGAFGRLSSSYNTRRFAEHITPAVKMIRRAAKKSGIFSQVERLSDIYLCMEEH